MFVPGAKRASAAGLSRLGAGNGPAGTGFTVSVAVRMTLCEVAEIDTEVALATVRDETVKVAVLAPAAIVTLDSTVAALVLLQDRATTAPPLGATLVSVTVPCDVLPPVTVVGLSVREDKLAVGGGGEREIGRASCRERV